MTGAARSTVVRDRPRGRPRRSVVIHRAAACRRALHFVVVAIVSLTVAGAAAQEIVQAVVLDLTVVEVQVIVAGTRGDERVQCLVRRGPDRARVVTERPVAGGFASGRTTIVSLPLPLLDAGEREFAVTLVRDGAVLARTDWRAISPPP